MFIGFRLRLVVLIQEVCQKVLKREVEFFYVGYFYLLVFEMLSDYISLLQCNYGVVIVILVIYIFRILIYIYSICFYWFRLIDIIIFFIVRICNFMR